MGSPAITLLEMQQQIKQALEGNLSGNYWVTAEINELKTNSAGHCYLELVEKNTEANVLLAKVNAAIWGYTFRMLKPYFETAAGRPLGAGIRVLVKVAVQYHPLYGLSLSITDIDPAYTVGEVEMQRRKTVMRLREDGVFDMNREVFMAPLPKRIAVISSEQAAGYRDFIKHLYHNEYGYGFRTQLFSSVVQGAGAIQSIIENLNLIHEHLAAFDVVVIIRGGGSAADLSCFDDYELALHVAQFPLPVITGIGHDKDESVVDLVAHTALKTPTAVADFLVSRLLEEDNKLIAWENSVKDHAQRLLQSAKTALQTITTRRKMAVKQCFQQAAFRLQLSEKEIHYKNPQNILSRGYAMVVSGNKIISDVTNVRSGDDLHITLYNGKIAATVKEVEK